MWSAPPPPPPCERTVGRVRYVLFYLRDDFCPPAWWQGAAQGAAEAMDDAGGGAGGGGGGANGAWAACLNSRESAPGR